MGENGKIKRRMCGRKDEGIKEEMNSGGKEA